MQPASVSEMVISWQIILEGERTLLKRYTYPNACNVRIPCSATTPTCRSRARLCKRTQATRDEPATEERIITVICTAQVEIVHILVAIAIGEIGIVDGGREKVSPDILCSVISDNYTFQPSAVARGVY